jgi:hypothetical protein
MRRMSTCSLCISSRALPACAHALSADHPADNESAQAAVNLMPCLQEIVIAATTAARA